MKVIPLGLQCSVPEGIKRANMREYSYPFDWLYTPSKTTYAILNILINDGIDKAIDYMTTGYTYYTYDHENYIQSDIVTEYQMNKVTGLGIVHFTINNEYKSKLRTRFERLLRDINSKEHILFVYADAANKYFLNYHIDGIEYGVDATDYLLKIYELIYPINNDIKLVYFCWNERKRENGIIDYISYDFKTNWVHVSESIKHYLLPFSKIKTRELLETILASDASRDEKYISAYKLFQMFKKENNIEKAKHYIDIALSLDCERVECVYEWIMHCVCSGNNSEAMTYYKTIQDYYEHRYCEDTTIQTRLEFNKSIYDLLLPYYMIIGTSRTGDYAIGATMFEIVFKQKWMETTDFYIGNLIYNFQFFCNKIPKPNEPFLTHMISYFNTMSEHDFKVDTELAKRYICAFNPSRIHEVKVLKEQKFSKEECKKCKNILIYTGFSQTPWNYTTMMEKGAGGAETCVAKLAKQFPSDYRVYIAGGVKDEIKDNVVYISFSKLADLLQSTPFQTVIISRYIAFLEDYEFSTDKLYIWIHDLSVLGFAWGREIDAPTIMNKWDFRIDKYICLTEWHKQHIIQNFPQIRDKIHVIPNGIESSVFPIQSQKVKNRFVFTSRPERGYTRILELWGDIEKRLPGAELKLATYVNYPRNADEEKQLQVIQNTPSIEWLGCLNSRQLYDLIGTAEYWLYPTNFCETFCITAIEMLRSEVICLYYPVAALQNTVGDYGIPLSRGTEVDTIIAVSKDTEMKERMKLRGFEYANTFDWAFVYNRWSELL